VNAGGAAAMSSGRVAGRGGGGGGGGRSRDQRTRPLVWVEAIQTWAGGWNLARQLAQLITALSKPKLQTEKA